MESQKFYSALAQELGMELDENSSSVRLKVQERNLLISFDQQNNLFLLYLEIGILGSVQAETVCYELLCANFLLDESRGAAFSLDRIGNVVGINRTFSLNSLDPKQFIETINNFVLLGVALEKSLLSLRKEQEDKSFASLDRVEIPQNDTIHFMRV